jgi:hypothetical protein
MKGSAFSNGMSYPVLSPLPRFSIGIEKRLFSMQLNAKPGGTPGIFQ